MVFSLNSLRRRFSSDTPPDPTSTLLPILSTVPRSGTWFIRYSISFCCHLKRGGHITDRITGQSYGDPAGPPFDFENFRSGPLFALPPGAGFEHLFIGHTVCAGFAQIASQVPWWSDTAFHALGYDYLHDGLRDGLVYSRTPVEMGRRREVPIFPEAIDAAPWRDPRQRMALIYRNPVSQARSFFQYEKNHINPVRRSFKGQKLEELDFADYLLRAALPSYAKQFVTYQKMQEYLPGQVMLVPYEHLMTNPAATLARLLVFLTGDKRFDSVELRHAVHLARQDHLRVVEQELNRSLDGTRRAGSHIQRLRTRDSRASDIDAALYARVSQWLSEHDIAPTRFVWPETVMPLTATA
jgi:hypothetical protein